MQRLYGRKQRSLFLIFTVQGRELRLSAIAHSQPPIGHSQVSSVGVFGAKRRSNQTHANAEEI